MVKVIKKGKPTFKEANDILPVPDASSVKTEINSGLFNANALSGCMSAVPTPSKNVSGEVNKSVTKYAPNNMWPV